MGSSQDPYTITDPKTAVYSEHIYIANIHNKRQEPTDINVLQLRILTNIFKILKIQKDEIHIVLNIVTSL